MRKECGRNAYRGLLVGVEDVGDNQGVEGAGAGGEASGNHVVDDVGDADGVVVAGTLHELLHETEAEAARLILLRLLPLPSPSLLRS